MSQEQATRVRPERVPGHGAPATLGPARASRPRARILLDLLRLAYLGGAIGYAVAGHGAAQRGVGVPLFIAFLVLLLARWIRLPVAFDLALIGALALFAWGTALHLFGDWWYYKKLVHTLSPILWLPALYVACIRLGILPAESELETPHNALGTFLILWALGFAVSAGYETIEGISTQIGLDNLAPSTWDMTTDMLAGLGGSAVGALFFVIWARRIRAAPQRR